MNLSQLISRRRLASRTGSILFRSLPALVILAGISLTPAAHAGSPLAPHFVAAQSVMPSSSLSYPYRCAVDAQGNLYISNTQGNEILKETLTNGVYSESVVVSSGLATPYGVAVDSSGNVYIADNGHNRVVKEAPSGSGYTQTVVTTSALSYPTGVAVDSAGTLYIADTGHGRILKEVPSGSSYTETALTYASNFAQITGITVDSSGDIFVSDIDDNAVYEETYSAGSYTPSVVPTSGLNYPYDLTVDSNGNLYIADFTNKRIVEETPSGGSYTQSVFPSYNLGGPLGIAVDGGGNVYLADTFGQDVLKFTLAGGDFGSVNVGSNSGPIYALFQFSGGGTAKLGSADVVTQGATKQDFTDTGTGNCTTTTSYSAGDSCAVGVRFTPQYPGSRSGAVVLKNATYHVTATGYFKGSGTGPLVNFLEPEDFFEFDVIRVAGSFSPYDLTNPFAAAVDAGGNVYVVDYNLNTVYKEAWTAVGYVQTTVVSGLNNPEDVAVDGSGAVYVLDSGNNQILKEVWSAGAWVQTPVITGLNFPAGLAVDGYGDVYYSSFNDGAVYELILSGGAYSSPITIATSFNQPRKIAIDGSGNVYVADTGNSQVVMETWTGSGYTSAILGSGMHYPYGLAVDAAGDVYVADTINSRILKESLSGGVYTQEVLIPGPPAYGVALDGAGNLYFPDPADATVFKLDFRHLHSLSFASTNVGATSSDSPQSFVVFNNGNAPLSISVPGAGTNPSLPNGFNLDSSSTCPNVSSTDSAGTLATGANCDYAINFTPVAFGFDRGAFELTDNDLNVGGATQGFTLSAVATLQPQAITFTPPTSPVVYGVAPIALSATGGGSGNPVIFSVIAGPGTITGGNHLTVTGAGTIVVAANQAGGSGYWGAPTVKQTVVVHRIAQTIAFTAPASPVTYGAAAITLTATGGASGNPVTFSVAGPGHIVGNKLYVGAGTVTVTAHQAGSTDYNSATPVSHSITVNKAVLTVTALSASRKYGAANPAFAYTISGFVNSDLAVHTVTGRASLTTTATPTSAVGTYPITAAIGTLASTNYTFTFVNAHLTVTLLGTAHKPAFTPVAGTYKATQSVTIIDKTPNAVIYYTTNGGTPTAQSIKYTAAISVSKTETLKAIAIAPGYSNSAVATAAYTIK
jgi:streptogramin lyase